MIYLGSMYIDVIYVTRYTNNTHSIILGLSAAIGVGIGEGAGADDGATGAKEDSGVKGGTSVKGGTDVKAYVGAVKGAVFECVATGLWNVVLSA